MDSIFIDDKSIVSCVLTDQILRSEDAFSSAFICICNKKGHAKISYYSPIDDTKYIINVACNGCESPTENDGGVALEDAGAVLLDAGEGPRPQADGGMTLIDAGEGPRPELDGGVQWVDAGEGPRTDAGQIEDGGSDVCQGALIEYEELNFDTGMYETVQLCPFVENAPSGIFYGRGVAPNSARFCMQINSDGTGFLDHLGGTENILRSRVFDDREEAYVEPFLWGLEVGPETDPLSVSFLMVNNPNGGADYQPLFGDPALEWDLINGGFADAVMTSEFPADAQSGACFFGEPRCVIYGPVSTCYENGVRNGPYSNSKAGPANNINERGQYQNNEKFGSWIVDTFGQEAQTNLLWREEREYTEDVGSRGNDHYLKKLYSDGNGGFNASEEGRLANRDKEGEWLFYSRRATDLDHNGHPLNAFNVVKEIANYQADAKVGLETKNYFLYDQELPTDPGAQELYYNTRIALEPCVLQTHDYDLNVTKVYHRGEDGCAIDTCNIPVTQVLTTENGETTCATPDGTPMTCYTNPCSPHN